MSERPNPIPLVDCEGSNEPPRDLSHVLPPGLPEWRGLGECARCLQQFRLEDGLIPGHTRSLFA